MTGTPIWRTTIVTLSFNHPFLLHQLFALTALHLVNLHNANPVLRQKYTRIAELHHMKSLSAFRPEVQNLSKENSDACCACSALLGFHAWTKPGAKGSNLFFASQSPNDSSLEEQVPWYKLQRGGNEVLWSAFKWVDKGYFAEVIRPWRTVAVPLMTQGPVATSSLFSPIPEDPHLDAIAESWTSPSSNSHLRHDDISALNETLHTLRYVFALTSRPNLEICPGIVTLSWTTLVPRRFCEMTEERVPQALLLVAVYCVLLKRIEEFWWIRGKAEDLLNAVKGTLLGTVWESQMAWCVGEVEGSGDGSSRLLVGDAETDSLEMAVDGLYSL